MHALAVTLFGEGEHLDALQMTLRAAATFTLMLAMIRVSGRRSIGQHRAFDFCIAVLLGSVLSRAVVGASPFWPTMSAGVALVVLHRLVAMASLRWPAFESLVSGNKRELVRGGRSLAGDVRDAGGFAKAEEPFLEFLWANYFRGQVSARLVKSDPKAARRKALTLASARAASHLPGWCGKR